MWHTSKRALALAGAAALPVLAWAAPAAAQTGNGPAGHGTKAQIERAERQATVATHPSKAQVEHAERQSSQLPPAPPQQPRPDRPAPGSGDAAAWQLGMSAALGALVTGAGVAAARQVSRHRHAVAS